MSDSASRRSSMLALQAALAAALRAHLATGGFVTPAPLFPVPATASVGDGTLLLAVAIGLLGGAVGWLATVANSSPFIGLFGTVWGIMGAFQGIGAKGSASLAVVAPGISEALIATATGLAAAIPAVVAYNYFVSRIRVLDSEMTNFSNDFLNIVRRHFFS